MKIINNRRSVRKFQSTPIEPEKIEKLLRAGMQAPSANNQQPWEFIIVKDKALKYQVSQTQPYATMAKDAPLVMIVAGNEDRLMSPENMQQDLGACTENILLEAVELGLGATWLGVFPIEVRVKHLQSALEMPENILPYAIIIVGYPLSEDANHYTDRYDESRVHTDTYKHQ